ncbi:hypothetical protein TWF694_006622 [Orbilia ellipsospora]|uniref:Uncharacterized protein n=1 Tax=Orbilia ellipsospora TaxID=2528407 RepID=A0AAV9XKT0_9PEZI
MPTKKEHRPVFERLRREYNIIFRDQLPSNEWPDSHRNVFEAIEKLKEYKYSTYLIPEEFGSNLDPSPWKIEAKNQAKRLTEKARDCTSRNEATWRYACEPLVFSRLTSEVACKNCRQRVWRSEIEAKLESEDRAAANLEARQQNRDRCRCPRSARPEDEDEGTGLSRLFIDRAEDQILYPPELARKLPQEQKPDRVYGLRQTKNFENLMLKKLDNGKFLENCLQKQPHPAGLGESLLFPFMVIEAKSGSALDDWASVRLQTAFPIYTYLNVQQSLKSANGQKSMWKSGPLVWFFMSKGDDWRLSLAYQRKGTIGQLFESIPQITEIVQVWNGCITNQDDALRLFLIVDFMSDWARDIYRPALLTELRLLASLDDDVRTVYTDTDIFSLRNIPPFPVLGDIEETESHSKYQEIIADYRSLDTHLGIVRHIAPIRSRFLSLFITADNVQTFLRSINKTTRESFVRRILKNFYNPPAQIFALNIEQLNGMEKRWTSNSRFATGFQLKPTKFYTVHNIAYYLSPFWEQIRDLCVIAIAEDAFDILIADSKSNMKRGSNRISKPAIKFPPESYNSFYNNTLNGLAQLRNAPAQGNLLASISRVSGCIDGELDPQQTAFCWFKPKIASVWLLLSNMYTLHKKGELEPELPFLHISASDDIQTVDTKNYNAVESNPMGILKFPHGDGPRDFNIEKKTERCPNKDNCSIHPHYIPPLYRGLQVSDQGAVLIFGHLNSQVPARAAAPSPICVYLVKDTMELPNTEELAKIIKQTFEDRDVYHTVRDTEKLYPYNDKNSLIIWNWEKSYGVFMLPKHQNLNFSNWLDGLEKPLPTRQGSPRGPLDSGRTIFKRSIISWDWPHGNYWEDLDHKSKEFMKALFAQEAADWANIAQQKIQQGISCCLFCATSRKSMDTWGKDDKKTHFLHGLCDICREELMLDVDRSRWSKGRPLWLTYVLQEEFAKVLSLAKTTEPDLVCLGEQKITTTTPLSLPEKPKELGRDDNVTSKFDCPPNLLGGVHELSDDDIEIPCPFLGRTRAFLAHRVSSSPSTSCPDTPQTRRYALRSSSRAVSNEQKPETKKRTRGQENGRRLKPFQD